EPHRRRLGRGAGSAAELRCGRRAGAGNISRRPAGAGRDRPQPDRPARSGGQDPGGTAGADPLAGGRGGGGAQAAGRGGPRPEGASVTPKDVMTVQEASRYLAIDEATLRSLAAERRIPCLEVDGAWV